MTVVDIAVLGRFSARDLAAAGLANAFFFSASMTGMGVVFGIDPLISQALGAGDHVRAHRVLWQGVWLALIVTAVLTGVLLLVPMLMPLAGVQSELIEPARQYLLIRTAGLAPFFIFMVIRAYLQARGNTRPMLVAMVTCNVVNFLGDLLFVFGGASLPSWTAILRRIPPLGAAGAAIATVIAQFIEVAIVAWAVREANIKSSNVRRWNGPDVARAFRVGWPIAIQLGAEIGIFALVGLLAGRLGTLDLAAHQVVIGLASFTYTMSLGVAAAGSTRVGLSIGRGNASATRAAGHAAFIGGAAVMTVAALTFAIFPEPLANVITHDRGVLAVALPLFVVAAFFQVSDGIQAVGSGVLRGAGDTRYSFVANIIGHWVVGLPVALYLGFSRGMGIVGLWWGLCAGLSVVAVLLFLRFERLSAQPIAPIAHV